jgi:hypothetical protein
VELDAEQREEEEHSAHEIHLRLHPASHHHGEFCRWLINLARFVSVATSTISAHIYMD